MSLERKLQSVIPNNKVPYGSSEDAGVLDGTSGVEVNCNVFEIWVKMNEANW